MDPAQQTASAVDELRQIRLDARRTRSPDALRRQFGRLQSIRRLHIDDFDVQVAAAEAQQEIVERARILRGAVEDDEEPFSKEESGAAEIPPEVPRLDVKSWQRAMGLALFLTLVVLAAFFYLIQSARKLNLQEQQTAAAKASISPATGKNNAASAPAALPSLTPILRIYTDLIPGTIVLDNQPPRNLTDGELILDHLKEGMHSVKLTGRSGTAAFQFSVTGNAAPQPAGAPSASDALVVLVSDRGGRGYLATNAEGATILLDGKSAGQTGAQGLTLDALGTSERQLEVSRGRDRQRFVWTYTAAPALTAYVKSDPNTGTLVLTTGEDGVEVYINNSLYRRKTERGPLRIPLRVGTYKIRVHKAGFIDPAPLPVDVKKSEETALAFKLEAAPEVASPILAPPPPTPAPAAPEKPPATTPTPSRESAAEPAASAPDTSTPAPSTAVNEGAPTEGTQVHKGGGFVSYGAPKASGRYSFQAQGRVGGFLKKSKLQWYAGYQDSDNYILFSLDGKHASVREVRRGKSIEWNRIPFSADSNRWVAVSLSIKADSIGAQVKTEDGSWSDLGSVTSPGRDFTQDKVGIYIPPGDEMAVSNFRFAAH